MLDIYKGLKPLGLNKRTIQSIEDVTNPLLNSINEKCARIRSAFVKEFDEGLAKNYFVTGERGDVKKISLPRDLVEWELYEHLVVYHYRCIDCCQYFSIPFCYLGVL